jgi:hypothetical protein
VTESVGPGAVPVRPPGTGPSAVLMGAIGLAIGAAFVLRLLVPEGLDPTMFLGEGDGKPIQRVYAERLLGEVRSRPGAGHDGKFFFAQANDPWFLDPEAHAAVLDRPLYRARRMLYPTLAGGFGLFPPGVVVWSLIVVNVFALGVGGMAAARIASASGLTGWLALAVPLNVGLIFEVAIDGAGVVAFACCLLGVWALLADRWWLAACMFAGAALGREVMLAFAAGICGLVWLDRRTVPWRLLVVPVVTLTAWSLYLWVRLGDVHGTGGAPRVLDLPFVGAVGAVGSWLRDPFSLAVNALIVAAMVAFFVLGTRSRHPLAWGALPFVPLAAFLAESVWIEPFDLARAVVPVFTAAPFVLIMRVPQRSHRSARG